MKRLVTLILLLGITVDGFAKDRFKNSKKNFESIIDALAKEYIDKEIDRDELYRLASQGLLEKLNKKHEWNKLLAPKDFSYMKDSLKSSIVGIGVMIEHDEKAGYVLVLGTVPGSGSFKAGIKAGDRILKVDNKSFNDGNFEDVISSIRGEENTSVKLDILRDSDVIKFNVVRQKIKIQKISEYLHDDSKIINIRQFSEDSVKELEKILSNLDPSKVKNIIFDARNCKGGLFDSTISALDLVTPKGKKLAQVVDRSGKVKQYLAKSTGLSGTYKFAVLTNEKTSSGCELFAGSLRANLNARLVGMPTFGKWNAQKINKLDNGFGYKFTTLRLQDPNGKSYEEGGLQPDLFVSYDPKKVQHHHFARNIKAQLKEDIQLLTAINLLK